MMDNGKFGALKPIIIGGIIVLLGVVVAVELIPTLIGDFNVVYLFTQDEVRNPIFATGVGNITQLLFRFFPILVIVGLFGIGITLWKSNKNKAEM